MRPPVLAEMSALWKVNDSMLDAGFKILIVILIVIVIFQFLIPEIEMADSLPVRYRTQTGNSALLFPLSAL